MKANYKNWVPKGMMLGFGTGFLVALLLGFICNGMMQAGTIKTVLCTIIGIAAAVLFIVTIELSFMHKTFSYNGKRHLSKDIVEGIAEYVTIPDGGVGLDIGCGSGALTIAVAKRNPNAKMIGIDRWGKEYASFNKSLCENNATAEGVNNVEFSQGDALKLDFQDEMFDAVTSNYVYHNIVGADKQDCLWETFRVLKKGGVFAIHDIMSKSKYGDMNAFAKELREAGYEKVELIDTTTGMFMSKTEAIFTQLNISMLLVGRK